MEFHLFDTHKQDKKYLDFLEEATWPASDFLLKQLKNGTFFETLGKDSKLYFLEDHGTIVGFGATTNQDFVPMPERSPWISFIYVDPSHRGKGLSQKIVEFLENQLRLEHVEQVNIMTQHENLYQRYGYVLRDTTKDQKQRTIYVLDKNI